MLRLHSRAAKRQEKACSGQSKSRRKTSSRSSPVRRGWSPPARSRRPSQHHPPWTHVRMGVPCLWSWIRAQSTIPLQARRCTHRLPFLRCLLFSSTVLLPHMCRATTGCRPSLVSRQEGIPSRRTLHTHSKLNSTLWQAISTRNRPRSATTNGPRTPPRTSYNLTHTPTPSLHSRKRNNTTLNILPRRRRRRATCVTTRHPCRCILLPSRSQAGRCTCRPRSSSTWALRRVIRGLEIGGRSSCSRAGCWMRLITINPDG